MISRNVGSVGWTNLSHAAYIRAVCPDMPIVNMRRDRDTCVASHLRVCAGLDRISTEGRSHLNPQRFNPAYPHNPNILPGKAAWQYWWDTANQIMDSFTDDVFDLYLGDLNDIHMLDRLADWLRVRGVVVDASKVVPTRYDKCGAVALIQPPHGTVGGK